MPSPPPPGHREVAKRNVSIKDFAGVNTQADRTAIGDNEFAWLENLIPIGHANLRALPAPSGILATAGHTIIAWQYVNIANADQIIAFLNDGSAVSFDLVSTLTTVAPASTFSGTPRVAQWKDERALIIASNGYWSWDGSTLTVLQGEVVGFTVTQSGSGYTSRPTAAISGTGSGATATTIIGAVFATLTAAGTNYAVGDVLTGTGGASTTAVQFQVTTTNPATGAITAFAIITPGDYTATPGSPVSVTGGLGTGATFTPTWGLVGLTLTNPGHGYTGTPTVAFSGGAGTGAAATVNLSSAPSGGTDIATYAGRVWVASGRTIIFSAPDSYTDFTVANAGGTDIITDEAFHSVITALVANNGYLYVFAANAINVISNVTVASSGLTAGQTSFSNNNITGAVGSPFPASLTIYERSVLFADSYGFHGVFGATTKKASEKIDGTFPYVDTSHPITGGLALMFNNIVPCFLFQYLDPANFGVSRPLIAALRNGNWFFASQGNLTLMCGAYEGDSPVLFGTDGTHIYRLFADITVPISTTAQTALSPMEEPWSVKSAMKLGIELTSPVFLQGTGVVQTEVGQSATVAQTNSTFQWLNSSGQQVHFYNDSGDEVMFILAGRQVFQGDVQTFGRYLGIEWTSDSPNYVLNGLLMQFIDRSQWGSLPNAGF